MTKPAVVTMPVVGMGATMRVGSDCYPYTVVGVSPDGRTVDVQADEYTRTDKNGYSEDQEYTYTANPMAEVVTYTLRRNGRYHRKGTSIQDRDTMSVGNRRAYQDPSF